MSDVTAYEIDLATQTLGRAGPKISGTQEDKERRIIDAMHTLGPTRGYSCRQLPDQGLVQRFIELLTRRYCGVPDTPPEATGAHIINYGSPIGHRSRGTLRIGVLPSGFKSQGTPSPNPQAVASNGHGLCQAGVPFFSFTFLPQNSTGDIDVYFGGDPSLGTPGSPLGIANWARGGSLKVDAGTVWAQRLLFSLGYYSLRFSKRTDGQNWNRQEDIPDVGSFDGRVSRHSTRRAMTVIRTRGCSWPGMGPEVIQIFIGSESLSRCVYRSAADRRRHVRPLCADRAQPSAGVGLEGVPGDFGISWKGFLEVPESIGLDTASEGLGRVSKRSLAGEPHWRLPLRSLPARCTCSGRASTATPVSITRCFWTRATVSGVLSSKSPIPTAAILPRARRRSRSVPATGLRLRSATAS